MQKISVCKCFFLHFKQADAVDDWRLVLPVDVRRNRHKLTSIVCTSNWLYSFFFCFFFCFVFFCFVFFIRPVGWISRVRLLRIFLKRELTLDKNWPGKHLGKMGLEKSPGSATITNRSPSQTPRGRGNRQNQTSANRTKYEKQQD